MTLKLCEVPECGRNLFARGFCNPHYNRLRNHGDVQPDTPIRTTKIDSGIECSVDTCTRRNIKARGLCRGHYEDWISDPINANLKHKKGESNYPKDSELIALFAEHKTFNGVARAIGVRRESLRDYLKSRPVLDKACRANLKQRLTPEQRRANDKAAKRKYRYANPETVKANKRKWSSGRDSDTVRKWNRHNRQKRADALAAFDMTPEDKLLSQDYEDILRGDPCSYCGEPPTSTVDHIQSVFAGGTDQWYNKTSACLSCNSSKREKDLLQFLLWRIERQQLSKAETSQEM